ncbi:MAG: glutamine amidotransferase [Eubacteriales bacterium]|nr:glutamine amidotransferase [Eubacteriales bacterium]
MKNILFVGESCFYTTTEYKGVDMFSETNYNESARIMREVFEKLGYKFTHIPCHLVARDYPCDPESLKKYDAVFFSDIGSNSFLLLPEMTRTGKRIVNRLALTKQYVEQGGGFCMIGGYLTFQGMDAKGKWKDTHIEDILPVNLLYGDDRCEIPEGADLTCIPGSHPILTGLPETWPYILGYNKLTAKEDAEVLVRWNGDPIITAGTYGKGRTLAYATDCTPHWAPSAMYTWEYYGKLWDNIVLWLSGNKNG